MERWQWEAAKRFFPPRRLPFRKKKRKGGRPNQDPRLCLEAILWAARTGQPWSRLPSRFPPRSTILRKLDEWSRNETLNRAWVAYLDASSVSERALWHKCFEARTGRKHGFWYWQLLANLQLHHPKPRPLRFEDLEDPYE